VPGLSAASTTELRVPFNRPYVTGSELGFIQEAIDNAHLSGNGPFTARCVELLREHLGAEAVLLTHSCTGALEMSALLAELQPGDEVVMPSFTFSSTASAFALRGAVPVFVDIRPDTLNLDERLVEVALTPRTRAIVAVHYAGVACAMNELTSLAAEHRLLLIEDAAQGYDSSFHGRALGTFGSMGTLSFHETKNVASGEGGALIVNDPALIERAEIIHEKGTNRRAFFRGQVDKYTWVDLGASFPASDITAAYLYGQLQRADWITDQRRAIWTRYHEAFAEAEHQGCLRRPVIPPQTSHNGHLYYLLLPDNARRERLIAELARANVDSVFHYVPLHSSPAGRRYGRAAGGLDVTDRVSASLLRLPLWVGMSDAQVDRVIEAVHDALR
jgi:dTDP-4-amino-4,6-dideoxygalactose transaminase